MSFFICLSSFSCECKYGYSPTRTTGLVGHELPEKREQTRLSLFCSSLLATLEHETLLLHLGGEHEGKTRRVLARIQQRISASRAGIEIIQLLLSPSIHFSLPRRRSRCSFLEAGSIPSNFKASRPTTDSLVSGSPLGSLLYTAYHKTENLNSRKRASWRGYSDDKARQKFDIWRKYERR